MLWDIWTLKKIPEPINLQKLFCEGQDENLSPETGVNLKITDYAINFWKVIFVFVFI